MYYKANTIKRLKDDGDTTRMVAAAIASPGRIRCLRALAEGPATAAELGDRLSISAVHVHHDLDPLRHVGLVRAERIPARTHKLRFAIDPAPLRVAAEALLGLVTQVAMPATGPEEEGPCKST